MELGRLMTNTFIIESYLKKENLTQKKIAAQEKIDATNFCRYLNNVLEPSPSFMKKMCRRIGQPLGVLFRYEAEPVYHDGPDKQNRLSKIT